MTTLNWVGVLWKRKVKYHNDITFFFLAQTDAIHRKAEKQQLLTYHYY